MAFNRRQRAHNRRVIQLLKRRLAALRRGERGHTHVNAVIALALIVGLFALASWAWPDLQGWARARPPAVACPIPAPHEQLHIVIVQRGRSLAAECMYVAPRGMAQRERGR